MKPAQIRRLILPAVICLTLAGAARADVLDDELDACKTLLLAGKADDAATRLAALESKAQATVASAMDDAHAQYILGTAAMYLGHDDRAKASLTAAARLEPKNVTYVMGRAQLAIYTNAPKDAVALLTGLLPANGKNLDLLDMLGGAQRDAAMYAEAQQTFQTAAGLAPTEPRYPAEVAECLTSQKKLDEALAAYRKALEINPKYPVALLGMSRIYQTQTKWDDAVAMMRQVMQVDPGDYRSLARIVQLYEAAGKTKERDAARDEVLAMRKAGKVADESFCREQFTSGGNLVICVEYFDFTGPRALRYAFNVATADGKDVEKRLSLGSYLETTALARERGEIKQDERLYHIDIYTETTHEVLKTFTKEPTYEETRDLVKQYLAGTLKPLPAPAPAASPAAVPSATTGAKP